MLKKFSRSFISFFLIVFILSLGSGVSAGFVIPEPPKPPVPPTPPQRPQLPAIEKIAFVHFPRPFSPNARTSTCPNPDTCPDYKYTGYHWNSTSPAVNYVLDTSNPNGLNATTLQAAVVAGFSAWTNANNKVTFTQVAGEVPADPGLTVDGKNSVSWRSISSEYPGAIGVTLVWHYIGSKIILEADTLMNSDFPWSINPEGAIFTGSYDVQNIATHEFGHWLMLGDLYKSRDRELTMYGYGSKGETKKDSLGYGDKLGIQRIYP